MTPQYVNLAGLVIRANSAHNAMRGFPSITKGDYNG
jgi:hypothetical protein